MRPCLPNWSSVTKTTWNQTNMSRCKSKMTESLSWYHLPVRRMSTAIWRTSRLRIISRWPTWLHPRRWRSTKTSTAAHLPFRRHLNTSCSATKFTQITKMTNKLVKRKRLLIPNLRCSSSATTPKRTSQIAPTSYVRRARPRETFLNSVKIRIDRAQNWWILQSTMQFWAQEFSKRALMRN